MLAILVLATAGCSQARSPVGGIPEPRGVSTSASAAADPVARAYSRAIPPTSAGPDALTLPTLGGQPVQDPALKAKTARELFQPGATVALTPAALRLTGGSVEGTMVATVLSANYQLGELIVRVGRFRAQHSTGIYDPPTKLVIPSGTIVRVQIPKPRKGATAFKVTDLPVGNTVALRVRIGTKPQGPYVNLLAVVQEGGARK